MSLASRRSPFRPATAEQPVYRQPLFQPLAEALLELLYPTRCVICERPGRLLCPADAARLPYIDQSQACPRCGAPFGIRLCTECTTRDGQQAFAFEQAASVLVYDALTMAVIVGYKDGNERRLASTLVDWLERALPSGWQEWADALAWVPADRPAVQRRGFDHMQLIGRQLAARLRLPCYDRLAKTGRADQRRLSRSLRRVNAAGQFSLRTAGFAATSKPPARLLLIDDVFTTGATLNAAALTLRSAGVAAVRTLTLARVW